MFDKEFEKLISDYGLTPAKYEECMNLIVNKINKQTDIDWSEIKEMYDLPLHSDSLRKASATPFGGAAVYQYYKNKTNNEKTDPDEALSNLQEQKLELQKERQKLHVEKLENNRWIRENARDELIAEKIIEAVKSLSPMKVPEVIPARASNIEYCLLFGDEHYGIEYEILGLFGETLNAYSPEIFENRMWEMLSHVVGFVQENGITKLNVYNMGDFTEGILRCKQLMKLRYGVIESSVKFANFLCEFLNKLTEYVNVDFQMVWGNHSELRMLGQPKGTFKDDNTGMFVREIVEARLCNNPNFTMTKNPTGLIFSQLCGLNVLGIHGEVKDLATAIKDFSSTYKTQIDVLIGGHLHHSSYQNVGINRDVIRAPSIIGIDDFSMTLNRTANAGATLIALEEGKGKVLEYNIKLK